MANVQHMCDLGRISKFVLEQPETGVIRAIVFDDEGSVFDIREFPDAAPISMITGVHRATKGPSVVCSWGYIRGRAVRVNTMVRQAIDALAQFAKKEPKS